MDASGQLTSLTFVIETMNPKWHPGKIWLGQEKKGSVRRIERISLYELPSAALSVGHLLSQLIYEDQLSTRRGSSTQAKGPRFDFGVECQIHLLQKIEDETNLHRVKRRWEKRELGTLLLPGKLPAEEICKRIASLIDQHWLSPPASAYQPPDQYVTGTGAVRYSSHGEYLEPIQVYTNGRTVQGPLLFLALEDARKEIVAFATLHQGRESTGELFQFYHQFALLPSVSEAPPFLLDEGVHRLNESLVITAIPFQGVSSTEGGENADSLDLPSISFTYWVEPHYRDQIQVSGGKHREALLAEIPNLWEDAHILIGRFQQSYSVYCSECQQAYLTKQPLEQLRKTPTQGETLTLCKHVWYCSACQRWSTPTERSTAFTWQDVCVHIRPSHPDRQLQTWRRKAPAKDSMLSAEVMQIIDASLHSEEPLFILSSEKTFEVARQQLTHAWEARTSKAQPTVKHLISQTVTLPWAEHPARALYHHLMEVLSVGGICEVVNEEVNDEDSGNSRKAREIYRSLSENTQIVSVLAALGKRHWEWEGVVWEDILSALRAYLYDTCTPGELRRLGLGRNLTTEERYWLLRAIWRCRAGLKPVKNVQAHTRLWIGLTQCEQFLDYAPKEQREVIKGIGYLVQHIGHYLTLWIVTSDDQPDALQKFKEQLGTRFQRFIDFELHEKS